MRLFDFVLLTVLIISFNSYAESEKKDKKMQDLIRTEIDDESSIDDPRVQHLNYIFEETGETIPYARSDFIQQR